jgi:hypothetical protein
MSDTPRFVDANLLRVGDRDFHCDFFVDDAPAERLPVSKPRDLVERYIEVAEQLRPSSSSSSASAAAEAPRCSTRCARPTGPTR